MVLDLWLAAKYIAVAATLLVFLKTTSKVSFACFIVALVVLPVFSFGLISLVCLPVQLLAFPKFGMLVRMVMVCLAALRYFLVVLCILIAGFAVIFMLLTGAVHGESGHYTGPGGSTAFDTRFDITELPVAMADTSAILLGAFDHAELWKRGPLIFTSWMLFMLFGNIVMLNCAPCSLFTVFSLRSAWAPVTLVSTQTSDTFQFSLRSAWAPVTQHNHLTLAVMAVLISIVTS